MSGAIDFGAMMQFWLEFNDDGQNSRFDFDQSTVAIGRAQDSDFHLDHPTVSRKHALIVENQGGFQLVVLSRNGVTAVDGRQVEGTVDIGHGQTLQLGEVQLTFMTPSTGANQGPGFSDAATEHFSLSDVDPGAPTAAMKPVDDESTEPSRHSLERPALAVGQASDVRTDSMNAVGGPNPFNAPSGGSSIDQPAPSQQSGFSQAPNGQSSSPANGSPQAPEPQSSGGDFGIQSWEEIAAQATGAHEAVSGPTDFERIQRAQAKAKKKSQGTSPVMLALLVLGIGGLAGLFLWDPEEPMGPQRQAAPDRCDDVYICYPEEKVPKCPNKEECVSLAKEAYKVADELYKRKDANVTNLYESYKQLDKADRFLTQAGVEEPPEEMKDYKQRIEKYVAEINDIAQEHRIRHHQLAQRKMNWEMAENVRGWQKYFPDRRNKWWDEAINAERRMKDTGAWPEEYDKKKKKGRRR